MVPVAASARVRDLLAGAPDGPAPVLHRGPLALYVEVAGRAVGLLAGGAVAVPCGLVSRLDRLGALAAPDATAAVSGGVLHVAGTPVRVGRLVEVGVPRLAAVRTHPGPLPAVRVGRGDGLTPYDDDVLAGWLVAHRAAGVATPDLDLMVRALFGRTTTLSATLLDCAMHGEAAPELAAYLRAHGTRAEPDAAARLAAVGGSSGRGLLSGARVALAHLLGSQRAAA